MKKNIKYYLQEKLSAEELALVPSSFDVVGDILIFADFPKELKKKEKIVAQSILDTHPNIKVVAKKTKQYSGVYRLPKLSVIGGEKRKETTHKENGISLLLNPEKVYFSPRLSTDRMNVSMMVKKGERILVLFSGCGPYTITLAKLTPCTEVVGIEINPQGHKYALYNAKLNKVEHKVRLLKGDVKKVLPKVKETFNRILMPLPKEASEFLPFVFPCTKKGTIIHLYEFAHEGEFGHVEGKILSLCKAAKKKCRILGATPCGQYSPGYFRVRFDVQIL